MKYVIVVTFIVASLLIPPQIFAVVNPLEAPNNKYGIHIIDENDLNDAATLVNSNGGEWGYVTIVIQDNDRDHAKWQRIFERMRKLKLIPVVRLATHANGDSWAQPSPSDAAEWADFLDSLNWVVQNRYVILFNEPNHAKEWGNRIDPQAYAQVAKQFRDELNNRSDDFFVLPAGLDLAAGNTKGTMDAQLFFDQMAAYDPTIFSQFDGWTSHSYPNPGFSGSVYATGRTSIRGFEWERSYLAQYNLPTDIPIFITETGWVHEDGQQKRSNYYSTQELSTFYTTAYTDIWTDPSIVMISPFVLNYQGAPFDHFSWRKWGTTEFHEHYHQVVNLAKETGSPMQIDSYEIAIDHIPSDLLTDSLYYLPVRIKNTGQVLGSTSSKLTLRAAGITKESFDIRKVVPPIEPNQEIVISVPFKTSETASLFPIVFAVESSEGSLVSPVASKHITVSNPPSLWEQFKRLITNSS